MDEHSKKALLELLQQEATISTTVLATPEEAAYFGPPQRLVKPVVTAAPKISLPPPPPPPPPIQEALKLTPSLPKPVSSIRLEIRRVLPHLALRDTTPDDTAAKQMARLWEAPHLEARVVLIAFHEHGQALEFLHNVAAAIDRLLVPARLIHGDTYGEEWGPVLRAPLLHTILISPWSSWKTGPLSKHYRQNGATGDHFLGRRPLLFLEPASHYLTHPELKRSLWKELNMRLSS